MRFSLEQSVAPASEPVSLAEARLHLRVDHTAEDTRISALITGARVGVETATRRQLMPATWVLRLDAFPCRDDLPIELPRPPIRAVSSISYVDEAGASQVWDPAKYQVDKYEEPGRILPAYGESYPSTRDVMNAVTVTYTAGFDDAAAVPQPYKDAMLLWLAELFLRREEGHAGSRVETVPLCVERVLGTVGKVWRF